ncbi:MAG TPA: TlpA disulfide reductase family protein [Flavisolibacter sp.]|nr:TlpA disulfide reductase family protein [Flavisolibacter sp.]
MRNTTLTILSLCLLTTFGNAQEQTINVNTPFTYHADFIINGKKANINTFRGKPVILELFASSCIVCFKIMPQMNNLKKLFGKKVQFLLVGKEDGRIAATYERFRQKQNLKMDVVFDSVMFNSLRVPSVPHFVWIDASGIVRGKTGPDLVDSAHISAFLAGSYKDLEESNNKTIFYNRELLENRSNDGKENTFLYRSILSPPIDSLIAHNPSRVEISKYGPFFQVINVTMQELYRYAMFNRIRWDYGDTLYGEVFPDVFIDGVNEDSAKKELSKKFCYSINTKPDKQQLLPLRKILSNDIENNFGYTATIEVRDMPYWSLTRINPQNDSLRSITDTTIRQSTYARYYYTNTTIDRLLWLLDYDCRNSSPFIDETGINYKIDILINAVMTDVEDVKKDLVNSGLLLEKRKKKMQVLVLRKLDKTVAAN